MQNLPNLLPAEDSLEPAAMHKGVQCGPYLALAVLQDLVLIHHVLICS